MDKNLQEKVSFALDENRMLILGSQVLLGFEFEAFFEPGFRAIPAHNQDLQVFNLLLIMATAALLIAPTTLHRIVGADSHTSRLIAYTTHMVEWALNLMAITLGLSIFCGAETVTKSHVSIVMGVSATSLALALWCAGPYIVRGQSTLAQRIVMKYATPLEIRLRHVLTESRVMLPGAQALLGFQLITFYMDDFRKLPHSLQLVHLISLLFIALAVILLIAPAAFHRIADLGEATERSYAFASVMVLVASIPLGLGLVGELFVILSKVTNFAVAAGGSALVLFLTAMLWFGYSYFMRRRLQGNT